MPSINDQDGMEEKESSEESVKTYEYSTMAHEGYINWLVNMEHEDQRDSLLHIHYCTMTVPIMRTYVID